MLACMLVKMLVGCPWSEWLTWRLLGKQQVRARKCWESILMILYWNCMILLCYFMCLKLKVMIIKGKAAVSRSIDCKTVRFFCVFLKVRASSQTKNLERGWKQRARLGRDVKITECPFCIRYIRSNYPLVPATGNSHWLNFDASCHQAVK